MKIYMSGHIRKPNESPETYWREIFTMYFDKLAKEHYKHKKVYPLPTVRFLHPLDNSSSELNAARDKHLMNICDMAVVYLNLNIGRCLGAMFEVGYLVAHNKPILLINESYAIPATHFIEHNSDVVFHSLDDGAKGLYDMIKDEAEEAAE